MYLIYLHATIFMKVKNWLKFKTVVKSSSGIICQLPQLAAWSCSYC